MTRFRIVPEDMREPQTCIQLACIRASVEQIPDTSASLRGLRSEFSSISANRPERILGSWHVTKGAARLVSNVLQSLITGYLSHSDLLACNPDCEIDYRRIRMLGANYTTLLIYGPICGRANRVQFEPTFNVQLAYEVHVQQTCTTGIY